MNESDAASNSAAPGTIERRTVLKMAAWATPAITLMSATPAFAASLPFTFTSATPGVLNAASSTTPVTVSGTGTTGKTITVSAPGVNSVTTIVDNDGNWSTSVGLGSIADGTIVITAGDGTTSAPQTVVKDTIAPALTHTGTTQDSEGKAGTISGNRGTATTATTDSAVTFTTSDVNVIGTLTQADGTWSLSWRWNSNGNAKKQTITISQTDGAGNSTTVTYTI